MSFVCCPTCGEPVDMTDSEVYRRHVTYWGDHEPERRECEDCGQEFYLKEHVVRTWSVGRTYDEADDPLADEHDGRAPPHAR